MVLRTNLATKQESAAKLTLVQPEIACCLDLLGMKTVVCQAHQDIHSSNRVVEEHLVGTRKHPLGNPKIISTHLLDVGCNGLNAIYNQHPDNSLPVHQGKLILFGTYQGGVATSYSQLHLLWLTFQPYPVSKTESDQTYLAAIVPQQQTAGGLLHRNILYLQKHHPRSRASIG